MRYVGPAELRTRELAVGEARMHETHRLVAHVGRAPQAPQIGSVETRVRHIADEAGTAQVGTAQVGARELHRKHLRPAQVRLPEVRSPCEGYRQVAMRED